MTEIQVTVLSTTLPASIIGTDEQGRTVILCPIHHDEAYVEPDGRVVCPMQDATSAFLAAAASAWDRIEQRGFLDEPPP